MKLMYKTESQRINVYLTQILFGSLFPSSMESVLASSSQCSQGGSCISSPSRLDLRCRGNRPLHPVPFMRCWDQPQGFLHVMQTVCALGDNTRSLHRVLIVWPPWPQDISPRPISKSESRGKGAKAGVLPSCHSKEYMLHNIHSLGPDHSDPPPNPECQT